MSEQMPREEREIDPIPGDVDLILPEGEISNGVTVSDMSAAEVGVGEELYDPECEYVVHFVYLSKHPEERTELVRSRLTRADAEKSNRQARDASHVPPFLDRAAAIEAVLDEDRDRPLKRARSFGSLLLNLF